MTSGDPVDPISLERALREMWETLAAHAGLNLSKHFISDDAQAPEPSAEWRDRDERLARLRDEAQIRLLGLIIVEEVRAWVSEGEHWKRPTQQALQHRMMKAPDEPWGLYVDRQQLAAVAAARWPEEFAAEQSSAPTLKTGRKRREVGRPRGPGYALKDVPVFKLILKAQRLSGDVESQHGLVTKFADKAKGASPQANVDRLRRGLPRWLEENGHEWKRSN